MTSIDFWHQLKQGDLIAQTSICKDMPNEMYTSLVISNDKFELERKISFLCTSDSSTSFGDYFDYSLDHKISDWCLETTVPGSCLIVKIFRAGKCIYEFQYGDPCDGLNY